MTPEQAKALRDPFPAAAIGKLPKPFKKESPKGNCTECGGYHGLPALHLDYVGHAATTDRLLQVDPEWTWEPMCVGPNGEPLVINGGLWIRLTVAGVTRPGWGDGVNVKEMIGDALRNAAMRFGVALDLWAKEDLRADDDGAAQSPAVPMASGAAAGEPSIAGASPAAASPPAGNGPPLLTEAQKKKLNVLAGKLRKSGKVTTAQLVSACGREPVPGDDGLVHFSPVRDSLTKAEASALIDRLETFAHAEGVE